LEIYVERMSALLLAHAEELGRPLRIVDLGCGDFEVARALLQRLPGFTYIGCDIVPELIAYNQRTNAGPGITFRQLDIVSDPLPEGDVCLVRQVLQHLSNADISVFLRKVNHPLVYVTEGHPAVRVGPFNPDKTVGHEVRFDWTTGKGRGVELDKPPFNAQTIEAFRAEVPPFEVVVTERLSVPGVATEAVQAA
jgi:SAM-dependent methyltransferase